MNKFMIGLVLVIIIIILIALLGALNKIYPENFLGTCKFKNTNNRHLYTNEYCCMEKPCNNDNDCHQDDCLNCYCQTS